MKPDPDCVYCHGHGWVQLSFDPDVDIDCPVCMLPRRHR